MASGGLVRAVRNLKQRKARRRKGQAVLEGVRLIEDALDAGVRMRGLVVSAGSLNRDAVDGLVARTRSSGVEVSEVDETLFAELSDTENPQGVLAVIEQPDRDFDEIEVREGSVMLVVDGVQDPGNVGTMIRTAYALGAVGVVLLDGTADLWNPKVTRSAMGASLRIPVISASLERLVYWLDATGTSLWEAAGDGIPVGDAGGTGAPRALVVGNEGAGVRDELSEKSAVRVSVPMVAGAESINVASATAVLLHEMIRGQNAG